MDTPTSATRIYEQLLRLEQDLQRLKIQTYQTLARPQRLRFPYTDKAIERAVKEMREAIWQKRYAQKITRVS